MRDKEQGDIWGDVRGERIYEGMWEVRGYMRGCERREDVKWREGEDRHESNTVHNTLGTTFATASGPCASSACLRSSLRRNRCTSVISTLTTQCQSEREDVRGGVSVSQLISINQLINLSVSKSISQSVSQLISVSQSVSQSVGWLITFYPHRESLWCVGVC